MAMFTNGILVLIYLEMTLNVRIMYFISNYFYCIHLSLHLHRQIYFCNLDVDTHRLWHCNNNKVQFRLCYNLVVTVPVLTTLFLHFFLIRDERMD